MVTHTGETMLDFQQATKPLHITEGIDGLTLTIETGKLGNQNASYCREELTHLYSYRPFSGKTTLQLDANDIDSSGIAILAIVRDFCRKSGGERSTLTLDKERGFYIERQLVRAGIDKDFEIRYH